MTTKDPDGTYPNQRPWAKPTDAIPLPPDLIAYLVSEERNTPSEPPASSPLIRRQK